MSGVHPPPQQHPYPTSSSSSASASAAAASASYHNYPSHPMDALPPPDSTLNMLDLIPDPEDDVPDEENIFRDMSFDEILEDLNARFLVNLPKEEMNLVRVYWQAEQAHWFYEDYLRPLNPLLPQLSQRSFTHLIIASSPLYSHLTDDDYDEVWDQYCRYKRMVPCCGGILINAEGNKVLMVRGWKSNAGWSFPRGKINSEESEEACAIREVEEETGFSLAGMVNPKDRITTQISAQTITMFIVKGIDEATVFETQTRKEIGAIEWVPFADLPTWSGKKGPKTTGVKGKKFYNVTPFVGPLKRWLSEHGINPNPKRRGKSSAPPGGGSAAQSTSTSFRALEPYFDGPSPGPSPQPHHPLHQHDHTALDNLFHRFIHKQEEDLAHPDSVGAKENKAGLQRLFQNLDVLDVMKQEDQAVSVRLAGQTTTTTTTLATTAEQSEDDALARLLGGLSSGTPAPRLAELVAPGGGGGGGDAKTNKLLSMLNAPRPNLSQTVTAQPPTHQASLLAMLSPKQDTNAPAPTAANPATSPYHGIQKPASVPTSPRPQSPGQEMRVKQQRALLEQITSGMGLDMPAPKPNASGGTASAYAPSPATMLPQPGQTPYETDRVSSGEYQTAGKVSSPLVPPPHQSQSPQSPHGRQPSHQYQAEYYQPQSTTDRAPPGPGHSPRATRNPPPPYEPVPSNLITTARPPQPPAPAPSSAPFGQPPQGYPPAHNPAPTTHNGLSHEQQNLLNALRFPPATTGNGLVPISAHNGSATVRRSSGSFPPAHAGPTVPGPNSGYRPHQLSPPTNFPSPAQPSAPGQFSGTHSGHAYAPPTAHAQGAFPPVAPNTVLNTAPSNLPPSGSQGYISGPAHAYSHQQQPQQQLHGLPARPISNQFVGNQVQMGQGYGYAGPPRPPVPPGPQGPPGPPGQLGFGPQAGQYRGPGPVIGQGPQAGPYSQAGLTGQAGMGPGAGASYGPQGPYSAQRTGPPVPAQGPAHSIGGGGMNGGVGGAGNFHHPVPRPPNSQTGVLLGMLNDGPR